MLYAIYPQRTQKYIIFDYINSINYLNFDEEKKINSENITLVFNIIKRPPTTFIDDFVFTNGPILVSEKTKKCLIDEEKKGFVQFFNVRFSGFEMNEKYYAMHIIHQEYTTNLDESQFEENDGEYDFEIQVLKKGFDWDLSIAKSKEEAFQITINEELKDKFKINSVKGILLYTKIDSYNDDNSIFIEI